MGEEGPATAPMSQSRVDPTPVAPLPEARLGGRYRLGEPLGTGGQGSVYAATDEGTGAEVAVKLHHIPPHRRPYARREIAALRWLRLPGVVRLLDDGVHGDEVFLVMERLAGRPFWGRGAGHPWETLREASLLLLGTLAEVHAAGLVHGDLKPSNVMLCDGRPVVLDFGLAQELDRAEGMGGTPGYGAPEQFAPGRCDLRVDLHAVGVMLYAALSGCMPRSGDPLPLGRLVEVPAAVGAVVDAMIRPAPAERPGSAREVLEALGVRPSWPRLVAEAPDAEALRALFVGPDPFHHLAEDAAALLQARAGRDAAARRATLDAWLHAGWIRREGEQLRMDRPAVERLGVVDDALGRRLQDADLLDAARAAAAAHQAAGRLGSAQAALSLALAVARSASAPLREIAVDVAVTALRQETDVAAERALAELERTEDRTLDDLATLLRAAVLGLRGDATRALREAGSLAPFVEEGPEIWRMGLRAANARRLGTEAGAQQLREMEAWADRPLRRAKWEGWLGNLRYREGRYDEAAELHLGAAAVKSAEARLAALLDAAWARLDGDRPAEADALAREAGAGAAACRHALYEAQATHLVRAAAYRRGRAERPRPDLVAAAATIRPWIEGGIALTEAAFAWRAGDAEAPTLARAAAQAYTRAQLPGPALLGAALAWLAGDRDPAEAERLRRALPGCGPPLVALQVCGLLGLGGAGTGLAAFARGLAPGPHGALRREILSVPESLAPFSQETP